MRDQVPPTSDETKNKNKTKQYSCIFVLFLQEKAVRQFWADARRGPIMHLKIRQK